VPLGAVVPELPSVGRVLGTVLGCVAWVGGVVGRVVGAVVGAAVEGVVEGAVLPVVSVPTFLRQPAKVLAKRSVLNAKIANFFILLTS